MITSVILYHAAKLAHPEDVAPKPEGQWQQERIFTNVNKMHKLQTFLNLETLKAGARTIFLLFKKTT